MSTETLSESHPQVLITALEVLRRGGLVAFPTDTVYGLGAMAFDPHAVGQLYEVKGRPQEKAIAVLIAGPEYLTQVADNLTPEVLRLVKRHWPGPLTIVVRRKPELPAVVSPGPTIGVRVPDHPFALALLSVAGPLAVTSANRAGEPSARTAAEVLSAFGDEIDLIVDGETPGGVPSSVLDCTSSPPRMLRQGPITFDELTHGLGVG